MYSSQLWGGSHEIIGSDFERNIMDLGKAHIQAIEEAFENPKESIGIVLKAARSWGNCQ